MTTSDNHRPTTTTTDDWLPPGGDAAIAAGCTCPRMDNGHGRRGDGYWVFCVGCPVHSQGRK